jgi:hypothetical protein
VKGPVTLEEVGDEDVAQAINQLNDRVSELEEEKRKLRGRIDELEEEVKVAKGGRQPSSKLQVTDSDGKLTEESLKVMRKTRDGAVSDGMRTKDVKQLLSSLGYDRHRSTVIEFMKKLASSRQPLVYRSANDSKSRTKHSRLIWDESKLEI